MEVVKINAEKREEFGTSHAKKLRAEGKIPAVLYSSDTNVTFSVTLKDIKPVLFTADFKLAEIDVDGKSYKCILKDYTMHPVTEEITHVDFQELVDRVKLKVNIPIELEGQAPGVRRGGVLIQKSRTILVRTLPKYLIDKITLDISQMKLGTTLNVRDLQVPEGMEFLVSPSVPVVSVAVPRVLAKAGVSDDEEEEEEEGATEEATEETAEA